MDTDDVAEERGAATSAAASWWSALGRFAPGLFARVEIGAYLVLGALLGCATLLAMGSAAVSLWTAALRFGADDAVVAAVDRLLFVFMLVEILHTVRVSFRTGTLLCEPFLIVGLIASIRRVLVITLRSSEASGPGKVAPSQAVLNATMLELGVLAGLILVMVASIYLLRRADAGRA